MSDKERLDMAGIHLKKQQLRDDLELLEGNFEDRIKNVRYKFLKSVNLAVPIKENPVKAVGIAIAAGLIYGISRPKKRKKRSIQDDPDRVVYDDPGSTDIPTLGFRTLMMDEIKRIAARRAAHYISELMDKNIKSNQ